MPAKTLFTRLGGRKATALWIATIGTAILILAGRWIAPPDQLPVIQTALDFLQTALLAFVGANAAEGVAVALRGKPGADVNLIAPGDLADPIGDELRK